MAIVIAESRYLAEDAVEKVVVDYEPLEPVANLSQALSPDSTPLWDKAESNVVYDWTDTYGDADAVFEAAIEAGAEDVTSDENGHIIMCAFDELGDVSKALEAILGEPDSVRQ